MAAAAVACSLADVFKRMLLVFQRRAPDETAALVNPNVTSLEELGIDVSGRFPVRWVIQDRDLDDVTEKGDRHRSALDVAYAPTCYPEVTDPSAAEPIRARPGDELALTILMHPEPAVHIVMEIPRPEDYVPGFTDNFASNEVIVAGLSSDDVRPLLATASLWPSYYANSANIRFHGGKGPELSSGVRFYFETFGFPVEAQVVEYVPPTADSPGRVARHGWAGEGDLPLDVDHAWLVENLPGGCVRILTQETQRGKPAQGLARQKPNP